MPLPARLPSAAMLGGCLPQLLPADTLPIPTNPPPLRLLSTPSTPPTPSASCTPRSWGTRVRHAGVQGRRAGACRLCRPHARRVPCPLPSPPRRTQPLAASLNLVPAPTSEPLKFLPSAHPPLLNPHPSPLPLLQTRLWRRPRWPRSSCRRPPSSTRCTTACRSSYSATRSWRRSCEGRGARGVVLWSLCPLPAAAPCHARPAVATPPRPASTVR